MLKPVDAIGNTLNSSNLSDPLSNPSGGILSAPVKNASIDDRVMSNSPSETKPLLT